MLSENQLYVIFRGCHTDWFIPVKDRNEGMGLRLFIRNWASSTLKIDITTSLKTKRNIESFPDDDLNDMYNILRRRLR